MNMLSNFGNRATTVLLLKTNGGGFKLHERSSADPASTPPPSKNKQN